MTFVAQETRMCVKVFSVRERGHFDLSLFFVCVFFRSSLTLTISVSFIYFLYDDKHTLGEYFPSSCFHVMLLLPATLNGTRRRANGANIRAVGESYLYKQVFHQIFPELIE